MLDSIVDPGAPVVPAILANERLAAPYSDGSLPRWIALTDFSPAHAAFVRNRWPLTSESAGSSITRPRIASPTRITARDRVLSDAEIAKLWPHFDELDRAVNDPSGTDEVGSDPCSSPCANDS